MRCFGFAALLAAACSLEPEPGFEPKRKLLVQSPQRGAQAQTDLAHRVLRRYKPLAAPAPTQNAALVELGRMLYFEPRLSATGEVSCNSCHPLDRWGTTHDATSRGVDGRRGRRNAPTPYNAARHFRQFWDGRAATLEEQAGSHLLNAAEMGVEDGAHAVRLLKGIRGYEARFAAAFPGEHEPITWEHVKLAIATFERGLITPGRWDRFLEGDASALTPLEKQGARAFANFGCVVCHAGELAGGSMYEKLGTTKPWPNRTDLGRAEVTGDPGDDLLFKVPGLRNVAHTGPYLHDGSVESLDETVRLMGRYQVGEELDDEEVKGIVAWFGALSGELPQEYIAKPELPGAP